MIQGFERMNRIYEEREREYQKFYDQIRSREEELERIGTTLAVQKEEQEKRKRTCRNLSRA